MKMQFGVVLFLVLLLFCFGNAQDEEDENDGKLEMSREKIEQAKQALRPMVEHFYSDEAVEHYSSLFHGNIVLHKSLTMAVPGRSMECLYEDANNHDQIQFEFESTHDTPIAMVVFKDPQNNVFLERKNEKEFNFETKANSSGAYEMCFHNTKSKPMVIRIVLEIREIANIVHFHLESQADDNNTLYHLYDKLWQIQHDIGGMQSSTHREQRMIRHDWDLMQEKEWYISTCSMIIMLTIIISSFLQVYYVRNMFNDTKPRRPLRAGDHTNLFSGANRTNGNPISTALSM